MSKVGVDNKHPEYMKHYNQIELCNNIYYGVDTSLIYLNQLERESNDSFMQRKKNATLKNFVKRAIEAFIGMMFRKHIEYTGISPELMSILDKVDGYNGMDRFARNLSDELLTDGKVFIGIDSPKDGEGKPYALIYKRNQIINWSRDDAGNYNMLVAHEFVQDNEDIFQTDYVEQFKVFLADGSIQVWRYNNDGNELYMHDEIFTEFDRVPFVAIELDNVPPLYDVAKMTVKHFNRTSVKDKYLDMCACPVPLVWGADVDDTKGGTKPVLVVGADEAFLFNGTKEECDFQWRELSGSSIDKLQNDLEVIEQDITTGIIRAATNDSGVMKTATQAFYEAAESSNRVVVIATVIEQGLNNMLEIMADIANEPLDDKARIIINKDFNAVQGGNDSVRILWEIYLGGGLSTTTFLDSLAKYEVVDIGNVADEMARITEDKFVLKPRVKEEVVAKPIDNNTANAIIEK